MNRASTTNGHPAASALAQGGYDAYFAQVDQTADTTAAAAAVTPGTVEPGRPEPSVAGAPAVAPSPSVRGGQTVPGGPAGAATSEGQSAPSAPLETGGQVAAQPVVGPAPESGPPAVANDIAAPPAPGAIAQSPDDGRPRRTSAPPMRESVAQWQEGASSAASSNAAQSQSTLSAPPGNPDSPIPRYSTPGAPNMAHSDPGRVLERVRPAYDNRSAVLPPALASPELLAEIAAVRQAHLRSTAGVRGALNKVGFSFGLSPAEQRAEDRRNRIRRALTTPYQIAVVSVKGGVGRTTTAAALGSTFAKLRPDRVAAVDANPDFGDLATRTVRHPYGLTLRDLATASHPLDSFSSVHAYTAVNAADLAVIASPWNSDASEALSGTEYATGVETLRRHYNLLLVDCGTGVLDSVTDMVLRSSDAVLVVTPATVGGVTGAVATLNWLSSHGFDHLIAASMVAIVHHQPVKPTVDVEAIEKLFASAQRPTRRIPFDAHLAEGGEVDLRLLDKETALAFEELAAGLADDFPGYDVGPAGFGGRA